MSMKLRIWYYLTQWVVAKALYSLCSSGYSSILALDSALQFFCCLISFREKLRLTFYRCLALTRFTIPYLPRYPLATCLSEYFVACKSLLSLELKDICFVLPSCREEEKGVIILVSRKWFKKGRNFGLCVELMTYFVFKRLKRNFNLVVSF